MRKFQALWPSSQCCEILTLLICNANCFSWCQWLLPMTNAICCNATSKVDNILLSYILSVPVCYITAWFDKIWPGGTLIVLMRLLHDTTAMLYWRRPHRWKSIGIDLCSKQLKYPASMRTRVSMQVMLDLICLFSVQRQACRFVKREMLSAFSILWWVQLLYWFPVAKLSGISIVLCICSSSR